MRRAVLIVPEWLGDPSFLGRSAAIARLAEASRIFRLAPLPPVEAPEALHLGLLPEQGQLRQGPLTVASLGIDPPERSTHFHLSLMSFADGVATQPAVDISADEAREVMAQAAKLNTKSLTVLAGENLDHALVWEGLGDLGSTPASKVHGQRIRSNLPQGDAEPMLRRFIDDSINLLSDLELNRVRLEEDLPPLNLLWPWGHGIREPIPNLALRRGAPALVSSDSMRLQGLARLAGYQHVDRTSIGRGLGLRLDRIADACLSGEVSITVIDAIARFRRDGKPEEADWLTREIERRLIQPLLDKALVEPTRLTLLAPSAATGLGLAFETGDATGNTLPFDERALDEQGLPTTAHWQAVESGVL